jgi:hypothetical protein
MFGDNQSVITSSTIPHSRLFMRHNALLYHRVREAIAANHQLHSHYGGKEPCRHIKQSLRIPTDVASCAAFIILDGHAERNQ